MRTMFRVCATERLFIPDIFPTLDKANIQTKPILMRMSSFHVSFFAQKSSRSMGFWWADIGILKKWRINIKYSWISAGRTCCHVEKKSFFTFLYLSHFHHLFLHLYFMKSCFIISNFLLLYSSTNNNQSLWSAIKWCQIKINVEEELMVIHIFYIYSLRYLTKVHPYFFYSW